VSLGVRLSRCVCVRRISLDGEGNVLYPVLSNCYCCVLWNAYAVPSVCTLSSVTASEVLDNAVQLVLSGIVSSVIFCVHILGPFPCKPINKLQWKSAAKR